MNRNNSDNDSPKSWKPTEKFTQVPNEFIRSPRISSSAKAVGAYLMSLDPCYPSYNKIMANAGVCRDTVGGAILELTEWNIIGYIQGNSHGRANKYWIKDIEVWKIRDQNFEPVKTIERSAKRTRKNRLKTPNVVGISDTYESENSSPPGMKFEPDQVCTSDSKNTHFNTNEKRSMEKTNGVTRPAAKGPLLRAHFANDPKIRKMKHHLTANYLAEWEEREAMSPGLKWFCQRLQELYNFFEAHPDHVPEFRKGDFIVRMIDEVKKYAKDGTSSEHLQKRFDKFIKQKELRQNPLIVNGSNSPQRDGMVSQTGIGRIESMVSET
ncbi:MAG: helix-turn-helix domain-containing protein [Bdellovibrionaceae bacterium]|nr:helix-turn-helix domain-containing protein [Pseudobdellovibrionaceae bacterium]